MNLLKIIDSIELGYSEALYNNQKYAVTKEEFNNGKSIKIYAEELGGNDVISLNYYITSRGGNLKPCEMPKDKVIHFLNNMEVL